MRDSHVRKNYGASPRDRPGWIRWRDRHPRAGRRPGCAAQKFRLASKSTDTMGKPANQPLYVHCCLRGAARNRWTRDSGRDELGTDRNQRILPQLPSSQFSQNHPLPHRKLNGFFFAQSTFGVVCHRVSSGRELPSAAPAMQSSEQSALHAAILSHRYS